MKRALSVYKLALASEIYADEIALAFSGINKVVNYKLVRVHKIQGLVRKYPKLFKVFIYFFAFLWPVLFIIITTCKFFYGCILSLLENKQNTIDNRVVLVFTPRIEEQIGKVLNTDMPKQHLSIYKGYGNVMLSRFCTLGILFKAYRASLLTPFLIKKLKVDFIYRLQNYTAFEWFVAWFTLNNASLNEIWFANHFDRWAVLCEYLPAENKVFVQHGIEDGNMIPIVRYRTLKKAYLIAPSQKSHFENKIFKRTPEIFYLEGKIKLVNIQKSKNSTLLIIGNYVLTLEKEIQLIKELHGVSVDVYLKPHPVLPKKEYYRLQKDYPFFLIEDSTFFPQVDLVVSYESTLGVEYEQVGVEVLYYHQYSMDNMIDTIKDKSKAAK